MKRKFQLKKSIIFICAMLIYVTNLQAQDKTVSGTVLTADDGLPLEGVSVMVMETSKHAITDAKGKYTLSIPNGKAKIVFSYIGFIVQTVGINNRSVINVVLSRDTKRLGEVVVTALGITRQKRTLGFATQELAKKDLTDARDVNVANFLTGKIAGVQVSLPASGTGGSSRVFIRGISSLTGENQPLYVVDGVPLDNTRYSEAGVGGGGHDFGDGIGNLNPQDIESISVLKGPNATALYGSRGSTGVIVITTKSGKAGKGIGVEVNSNTTIEKLNLFPNLQNKYGPGYEDKNVYGELVPINGVNYETLDTWHTDNYGAPMNGTFKYVNPFVFDPNTPPTIFTLLPQPSTNVRDFWDMGVTTNNSVALSGGSEKSSARLSFNNTTIKGITPNHTESDQSINLRVATQITSKLSFDAKVNYIHRNIDNAPALGKSGENIAWDLTTMGRYVPLDFLKAYYDKTGAPGRWPSVANNPYYVINALKNNAVRDRIISFVSAKYQFNNWLSLMARSGIDFYSERRRQTWPVGSQGYQGFINASGRIIDDTYLTKESNSDVLLTASKNNLKNFSASLSVGASLLQRSTRLQGWDASNFKVPGIYDVSNAKNVTPYYSFVKREMQSVYATGDIGYKNYLFLNLTGRNDWSSTLGVNNYSFFYPSIGSSFVFTDALKINSKVLTYGKLRASYAEAGNDASPYLTQSGYFLNSTPVNGQSYASQSNTIALYNLKNELKKSIEFGADLRFFDDRIGMDVTYYKSNTKNQILPIAISQGSGYAKQVVNAGNVENKGIEITLNATPVQLRNGFRWDMSFNYAHNQSKVIELAPGIETLVLYGTAQTNQIEARVGKPYGNIVGFAYKRSPDGQRIVGPDGAYMRTDTFSVLGNTTPKWIGGLNNTFSFKGFTLNVLIDFVQGNQITSDTRYQMMANGTGKFTEQYREHSAPLPGVVAVTTPTGTKYEKNTQLVDGQTAWAMRAWGDIGEEVVLNGSYVKLREVILGYTVKPSFIKKTPFKSIGVSLVGRNLWYIEEHMKGMGISPEVNLNTQAAASGVEVLSMPTTRSYGINFNFTF